MTKRCENCFYRNTCDRDAVCEYYDPIRENEEEVINEAIETERDSFHSEWNQYEDYFFYENEAAFDDFLKNEMR